CESARGNLPFQRSIHFFRVLQRAASFRVLLGPTIDADKEITLALQRGESRIHRAGGQRPKISRQIRRKRLTPLRKSSPAWAFDIRLSLRSGPLRRGWTNGEESKKVNWSANQHR